MLDARVQALIATPLDRAGHILAHVGVSANAVTMSGLAIDIAAIVTIAYTHYIAGLALIAVSRILDGLDGAVARASVRSNLGGYLDIVTDLVTWYRTLIARKWDYSHRRGPGRPRTRRTIVELIVRMAIM